jgi:hypothetical protein
MFTHSVREAVEYARLEAIHTGKRHVVVPTFKHRADCSTESGFTVVLWTKQFARLEKAKAIRGEKEILARISHRHTPKS